jgi:hypothetical protein
LTYAGVGAYNNNWNNGIKKWFIDLMTVCTIFMLPQVLAIDMNRGVSSISNSIPYLGKHVLSRHYPIGKMTCGNVDVSLALHVCC